jgi:hypothetical protein
MYSLFIPSHPQARRGRHNQTQIKSHGALEHLAFHPACSQQPPGLLALEHLAFHPACSQPAWTRKSFVACGGKVEITAKRSVTGGAGSQRREGCPAFAALHRKGGMG